MKESYLKQLRDRKLGMVGFRRASISLSKAIASEFASQFSADQKIILVPVLRAGLVLLPAFQEIFIGAPIGLIGIRREEKTALPHLYYQNLPPLSAMDHILVLDPMLATGGSSTLAIELLKKAGGRNFTLVAVIAAPEGLCFFKRRHPEASIYTVAVDEGLDAEKFIVPGLGDFGDRYFGTI